MSKPLMICERCGGTGKVQDPREQGKQMKAMREAKGVSARSVAQALGFSAAYVSDLELGKRAWSGELIGRYKLAVKSLYK